MQPQMKASLRRTLPVVLETAVGVPMVLISWWVISVLPMLRDVYIPLRFSLPNLIAAVLLTILALLLIRLGSHLKRELAGAPAAFPHMGRVARLVAWLASAPILYSAFLPLAIPYAGSYVWIYSLAFLLLFVALLASLGYTVFSGMRHVGEFLQQRSNQQDQVAPGPRASNGVNS